MRRHVRSHPVKLCFRLTFLLASLTGMATTIVAEEGARCGVVGMIELGAGPGSSTTCCRISVICPKDRRARTARQFQAHSACRCQQASIQDIPVRVLRLKRTRVRGHPVRRLRAYRGYRGHRHKRCRNQNFEFSDSRSPYCCSVLRICASDRR